MGKRKSAATIQVSHIAADLRARAVAIGDVRRDSHNCKKHTPADLAAVEASLREFGQQRTIIAHRKTRTIVAGNGTHEAAERLGWPTIAVDWTDLPPAQARAFALADNRTAQLSAWDAAELQGYLDTIAQTTPDLYNALALADLAQTTDDSLPDSSGVPAKFSVIVEVADETAQKRLFEFLKAQGHENVRLSTS